MDDNLKEILKRHSGAIRHIKNLLKGVSDRLHEGDVVIEKQNLKDLPAGSLMTKTDCDKRGNNCHDDLDKKFIGVSDKFRAKSEQGMYGDVMMEIDWSVGPIVKALRDNKIEDFIKFEVSNNLDEIFEAIKNEKHRKK